MALTAKPWSPGTAHDTGMMAQRLSLDGQHLQAQPSGGVATMSSLGSSQLEDLYSAFNQRLQLPGALALADWATNVNTSCPFGAC